METDPKRAEDAAEALGRLFGGNRATGLRAQRSAIALSRTAQRWLWFSLLISAPAANPRPASGLAMNEHRSESRSCARALLGGAVLLIAGAVLVGVYDFQDLAAWVQEAWGFLQTLPAPVYFTVMTLACILPVPISPFYAASGPLFGFATALFWIAPAVAVNQLLTHRLAGSVLRPWLERLLARRGYSIPKPRTKKEQTLITLLIRISPAPYSFQNWILGLAGIERLRYFAISWPIQMAYAAGWVLLGQSAFEGRFGIAAGAVALILCLALVSHWCRERLQTSGDGFESASER